MDDSSDNDKLDKIIEQLYPNLKFIRDKVNRYQINKIENEIEKKEELEYCNI